MLYWINKLVFRDDEESCEFNRGYGIVFYFTIMEEYTISLFPKAFHHQESIVKHPDKVFIKYEWLY